MKTTSSAVAMTMFGLLSCQPPTEREIHSIVETSDEATDAGIEMADAGTDDGLVSFSQVVMPILTNQCTGCHRGVFDNAATAYPHLKGTTSATTACANQPRLVVNDGNNSLLVTKMRGTIDCGKRMPSSASAGCVGEECTPETDIAKIAKWIDQGALDN